MKRPDNRFRRHLRVRAFVGKHREEFDAVLKSAARGRSTKFLQSMDEPECSAERESSRNQEPM